MTSASCEQLQLPTERKRLNSSGLEVSSVEHPTAAFFQWLIRNLLSCRTTGPLADDRERYRPVSAITSSPPTAIDRNAEGLESQRAYFCDVQNLTTARDESR